MEQSIPAVQISITAILKAHPQNVILFQTVKQMEFIGKARYVTNVLLLNCWQFEWEFLGLEGVTLRLDSQSFKITIANKFLRD